MQLTTARLYAILTAPFAIVLIGFLVLTSVLPAVTLQVERISYRIGDEVGFVLHNGRNDPVMMSCASPWSVRRDIGGEWKLVEEHVCAAMVVMLEPGESRQWAWTAETQTDHPNLAPVEPGRYRIDIRVRTDCTPSGGRCDVEDLTGYFRIE